MSSSSSELQVKKYGSKTSFLQQVGSVTSIKSIEIKTKSCFTGFFKGKRKHKTATRKKKTRKDLESEILKSEEKLIELNIKHDKEIEQMKQEGYKMEKKIVTLKRRLREAKQTESENLQKLHELQEEINEIQKQHKKEMIETHRQFEDKEHILKTCSENLKSVNQQLEEMKRCHSQDLNELKQRSREVSTSLTEFRNYQESVSKLVERNVHVYGDNCSIQAGKSSQMVCEQHGIECLENLLEKSVNHTKLIQREQAKTNLQLVNMKVCVIS